MFCTSQGSQCWGQGAKDLGRRWHSPPSPHVACKLSWTSSWDTGCEATCSRGCFAHSDKTYLRYKLWGYSPSKYFSGCRWSVCWHNLEEDDQKLIPQERWQVKYSKNSRASPAAPAAHKPSTALRHSYHVCLFGLPGCFPRFSLLLHPWVRPCIQSVLWMYKENPDLHRGSLEAHHFLIDEGFNAWTSCFKQGKDSRGNPSSTLAQASSVQPSLLHPSAPQVFYSA